MEGRSATRRKDMGNTMKNELIRRLAVALLALALILCPAALAQSYTAGAMRLLHCEGTVEILDAAGSPRFIMENARFDSGETLVTGEDGVAAVGLDADRIVSLDSNSRVIFEKQGGAMKLTLAEGALLLDVQKKLDPNETLDIQTSTMTVGIRGTIVYLKEEAGAADDGVRSTLGVVEGTAELTYLNPNGVRQTVPVSAGEVATLTGVSAAEPVTDVLVKPLTPQDVPGFVTNLPDALSDMRRRVEEVINPLAEEGGSPDYPASGSWTWDDPVTLVAQSASKLYDGQPLTRPSDVLVYGLPAQCTIRVTASGSQTDAGESTNRVDKYQIYNAAGMDVTSHFTNVQEVNGRLVVDPAPLTVWTGSAEKVYDGTPLTNPEAGVTARPGYEKNTTPWRNLSYVQTTAIDAQVLLGMCGVTWVHGTNPLTGDTNEIALRAGEKLTVVLNDEGDAQSIEFKIEKLSVEEIPEEALRLYARNPEVLKQACLDAGWDPEALAERIAQLAEQDDALVSRHGLDVSDEEAGRLMVDCTDVRITVDTKITNYDDRPLGSDEAHFTPVHVPEDIVVTATGRRTEVGQSPNFYEITWGDSDPRCYRLSEELGTLTVTPSEEDPEVDDAVTLTADSASKVYDGAPLTADGFTATGLPEGYTATAVTEGSQTDAGTGENSIASYNILDAGGEDVTEQFTNVVTESGTLEVTPAGVTIATGSETKPYDGRPLTCDEAAITGLVAGETATITATGSITDVGTATNTYAIDWGETDKSNYTVTESLGTLEVTTNDVEITLTSASGSKVYDGMPLNNNSFTATGLPDGVTATAFASDVQIDVGSGPNLFHDWAIVDGDGNEVTDFFTNIHIVEGTVTVTPAEVTVTTGSESKVFDGKPLTGGGATITGLVKGESATVTATGTITDVGSAENTYAIDWGETRKENYTISESLGTLEVTPLAVSFDLGGYTAEYCGDALLPDGPSSGDATGTDMQVLTDDTERDIGVAATFSLPGGEVVLTVYGFEDAGSHTLSAQPEFTSGKAENYTFSYTNTAMTIVPMEVTIRLHDGSDLAYNGDTQLGHFSASGAGFDIGYELDGERAITWGSDRIVVNVTGGGADAGDYTLACTFAPDGGVNMGNYHFNVTGTAMTIVPAPLTVTTGTATKPYDGTPLTAPVTVTGLTEADESQVTVTATGTITDAGSVTNTYDIDWGAAKEGNYALTEELGTLRVSKRHFVVTTYADTGSSSKQTVPYKGAWYGITYSWRQEDDDGNYIPGGYSYSSSATVNEFKGTYTWSWGDVFVITVTGGGYNIGTYPSNGSVSFTAGDPSNYAFEFTNKTLTIEPAPLTVTTGSATKPYDGTPLTNGEATLTGLVNGETVTVEATGSQTEVGESSNTYKITWPSDQIAANYTIVEELGTLKVTQLVVTVTSPSVEKVYDGKPLTPSSLVVDGLPEGYYYRIAGGTLLGSQTDVGESDITIDLNGIGITREDSIPVDKGNFNIVTCLGTLKVTPATLTVTTATDSKPYDGTPLTNGGATLTGLVNGETATVEANGSQTDVGDSKNTYKITWGTAKADNYTISEDLGTLTVVASTADLSLSLPPAKTFGKPKATDEPTPAPTAAPTEAPEPEPTEAPESEPTEAPTEAPEPEPTPAPTEAPEPEPTEAPTEAPEPEPTEAPTEAPEPEPTEAPSEAPTSDTPKAPEGDPTAEAEPAAIDAPTDKPADAPKAEPAEEVQEEPAREAEDKSSKEAEEKPSKEAEDQPVKAAEDKPVKEVAEKPAETPVDDPGEIPSDDAD